MHDSDMSNIGFKCLNKVLVILYFLMRKSDFFLMNINC